VTTRTEADVAVRTARLLNEEEKVLRMRYGIPLGTGVALEACGQEHAATRDALVAIEQRVKAHLAQAGVTHGVDLARRAAVIERLKKM
jgi:DNA-directed RNA polymerase sigma subunit (sigma70/sigma32)